MTVTATPILSINPATEEVIARFDAHTDAQVDGVLDQVHRAFRDWRRTPFTERSELMHAAAKLIRERKERYARLASVEMGKPITQALAEVEKCAWNCDFYADSAQGFLADEVVPTTAPRSKVAYEPLGVVLAVMPWNFPFWQVIRFAAPALMAGNTAILKHASNVPQCALACEEIFRDAGFPEGVFRAVLVRGGDIERLIADDRVSAVTLTGSSDTGSRIARRAGEALKKTVLELGGSDPYIVLRDADLDAAAATAARARTFNSGQSCIAAKRFIVDSAVAKDFERKFGQALAALKVGDPLDPATQVGPLAREDLVEALDRQVQESVRMGARVVTGGRRRPGKGYFYEPTLLADVTDDMPVFREETFGPAAALRPVADTDEAIRIANDTAYGLAASLWTRDETLGEELARRIEAGTVFVNGMVSSDPRLPFGGIKKSGYGRELGVFGIREFVNIQTVVVGGMPQPQQKPAE